jgi:hypothetical protein
MWDLSVYAKLGRKVIVQGQIRAGLAHTRGHTQTHWEHDLYSLFSVFLLWHFPGSSYYNSWGNGYQYGSGLTESWTYYKAGVPRNFAYQPTSLMQLDLVFIKFYLCGRS